MRRILEKQFTKAERITLKDYLGTDLGPEPAQVGVEPGRTGGGDLRG
jgi:hypothetical protein